MKVSRVQSPRSKVQSRTGKSRAFFNLGRWALDFGLPPSRLGGRKGIALVITLIMLSIITFMAVTFLVLSQRERSSVSTATDQKIARDASDTAFSRVSAELLTRMITHTNFQDFDLLVSTNYINSVGLNPVFPAPLNPTNVNYDYLNGAGGPLDSQSRDINIASLLYNPRPPVYVVTNNNTGQADFRFYLDLNRNGRFDTNGTRPVISSDPGFPFFSATNGQTVARNFGGVIQSNNFVGDPEWIGQLARPGELHSADNQFISRYAYLVVPAGKTLDVNTIHNQAVTKTIITNAPVPNPSEGYLRNQGVGPWEINLAAFLVDLNTNIWPGPAYPGYNPLNAYQYNRPFNTANQGRSFQDAYSILSYRYNNNYNSLMPANALFFAPAQWNDDNIDEYADGPVMTTTTNLPETTPDPVGLPWAGAENTNHYFSQQDLFNRTKVGAGFAARLQQAGSSNDSYNAYTFYRMLSQLGSDSTPDTTKLNINYKNTDIHGNIVPGMETNHIPWTPEDFFTNAASRILATMTNRQGMGVALSAHYIPVYPTNYYTPAVHRALQLAANIFDAATNQTVPLVAGQTNAYFPSVFRPIFTKDANGQIYISDYKEATDATEVFGYTYMDFNTASNQLPVNTPAGTVVIYGVPWVVGAKKGFPNFNQFAFQTTYALTRKLLFERINNTGETAKDYSMKQEFVMDVTNQVGMDAWNSYRSAWPMASRQLRLFSTNIFSLRILNDTNPFTGALDLITPQTLPAGLDTRPPNWLGYNANFPRNSFKTLIDTNNLIVNGDNVAYNPTITRFAPGPQFYPPSTIGRVIPQYYMITTNRVVYALIDESVNPHRIVDFVNLDNSGQILDFTGIVEAQAKAASVLRTQPMDAAAVWRTNSMNGVLPDAISDGLDYQIEASLGAIQVTGWNNPNVDPDNGTQTRNFRNWLLDATTPVGATNGAPFSPTIIITNQVSWEANDPLVHYTIPDLTDMNPVANKWGWTPGPTGPALAHRYSPWDFTANGSPQDTPVAVPAMAKKDANAVSSDVWDFPTNKFWNVGILGRVHRGTPWQTVYMKSPVIAQKDWINWSGNFVIGTNGATGRTNADAAFTMPVADYSLFDLFTTSPDPNASRGQLNVNQTNLAAWSAVLSGVNVITNGSGGAMGSTFIAPAGVYDPAQPTPMAKIWQGILRAKNNTNGNTGTVFPNHTFQHAGDVLAAPELTVASPFVSTARNSVANDEVYERIPQQIMSLLTLNQSPRFVIYSFGQTLHPAADHPLVTGGAFNGLCTNYQITAESATRAVVRVEGTSDPQYQDGKVDSQGRSYPPHLVVEEFNVLSPD